MLATHKSKPVIGILGGIGSGKSTVAAELSKLGCAVIDADQIAHAILDTDESKRQIQRLWGPELVTPRGEVNRERLGELVFSDAKILKTLNDIIHPRVLERCEALLEAYGQSGQYLAIVLDMPLLLEVGWETRCDHILYIDCPPELRLQRFRAKGPFSQRDLEKRESFQISLDTKRFHADNTIHNYSDLSTLTAQLTEVFSRILNH